jgi:threonine dehydrogenase-like Zn-dependent dehydrogenase
MKAAIFRGVRDLQVEDVPEPSAGPGDIVVGVRVVGVCGSDLHSYTHGSFVEPGQIMGHEFAGEVVEVGDGVADFATGDRVTAMPIVPCGACPRCAEGRFNLCAVAWTQALAYGRPGAFAPAWRSRRRCSVGRCSASATSSATTTARSPSRSRSPCTP